MVLDSWCGLYEYMLVEVKFGVILMVWLDDVVVCILWVKFCVGLFEVGLLLV